jgi:anti-anti-sigma factor
MSDEVQVTVRELSGVNVVRPEVSVVDLTNADRVMSSITAVPGTDRYLVLDLGAISFIDSTGLGKIVALVGRTREAEGAVALCNVRPSVMVLFNMVKLHQIIGIFTSPEDAVANVAAARGQP